MPRGFKEKDLGLVNEGLGICGFTSTFHAMYRANPAMRGWLVNATQVYSVLYEITDYLQALKSAGQLNLVHKIEEFTRTFPGFNAFTINGYINTVDMASEDTRIRLAIGDIGGNEEYLKKSNILFGIAMPPEAVADYIKRMWKWNATISEFPALANADNAIVGVRKVGGDRAKPYHGLCHYLYRGKRHYYSWGQRLSSKDAIAGRNYQIVYEIKVTPP